MFCPKCGDQLERYESEMICLRGNMALSALMEAGLEKMFVTKTTAPADKPFPFPVGGKWFCPGDGERMIEANGVIRCPSCLLSLNPLVQQLVELHPHKSGSNLPKATQDRG